MNKQEKLMVFIALLILLISAPSNANGLTDSEELAELEAEQTAMINIIVTTDEHLLEIDETLIRGK